MKIAPKIKLTNNVPNKNAENAYIDIKIMIINVRNVQWFIAINKQNLIPLLQILQPINVLNVENLIHQNPNYTGNKLKN